MFVAINYITCQKDYKARFEQLMGSRAMEVDTMPGFIRMEVLRPDDTQNDYLIISHWDSEEHFKDWKKSEQFTKGHKRGFEDISIARRESHALPMKSTFKTYKILSD
jgi:heme-degrading monooxygenase HmoA